MPKGCVQAKSIASYRDLRGLNPVGFISRPVNQVDAVTHFIVELITQGRGARLLSTGIFTTHIKLGVDQ